MEIHLCFCLLNHPLLEDFVRLRTKSPSKGGEGEV